MEYCGQHAAEDRQGVGEMQPCVNLGGITVGDGHPVVVCAELGTNFAGDLGVAKRLIREVATAGCLIVKTQKRTPELSIPRSQWDDLRDTPWGQMSKLEYRRRVEIPPEAHVELATYAKEFGLAYFTSVWDIPSAQAMADIGQTVMKIPSARAQDRELLAAVARMAKTVILSTGGCRWSDVQCSMGILLGIMREKSSILINQCTMAYPARADQSDLRVIQAYKDAFRCPAGFSSHKIGVETCLLAVAVGANLIERHVTLCRRLPGSDHRMSSETPDLRRLVERVRYAEAALGDGTKKIYPEEEVERQRLRGTV